MLCCTNACVTDITLDIVSSYSIQTVHSGWVALERLYVVTAMLSFEELSSNICLHVNIALYAYCMEDRSGLQKFLNQEKALVVAFSIIVKSSRSFVSSSSDESVDDTSLVGTVAGCPQPV